MKGSNPHRRWEVFPTMGMDSGWTRDGLFPCHAMGFGVWLRVVLVDILWRYLGEIIFCSCNLLWISHLSFVSHF